MKDYLFRGNLDQIDSDVEEIINREKERQIRKLILIPSESMSPAAVRECLGSVFQNLYAEGYPDEESRWMGEEELLNHSTRLNHYRRFSDPRYYKGVEFADMIESLARRRCAEVFATKKIPADELFVNVQPLSGAPANNAAYHALIEPGDTIMGMNLFHGGHLTHGSSVNRSGKLYQAIHYSVDPDTEKINYETLRKLVEEKKPRVIVAGYSAYPWVPDWQKFREIADSVGSFVLADISHIAGLIASGVIPSPVGFADVITFTTHKTLCGPRGACILTTDESLAKKIDKAVFPGEQGGPHVNVFAALAVTFKLAKTQQFKDLQKRIVINCHALNDQLQKRGFRIAYGGTNTHLTNIDCKSVKGNDGALLSGDMGARILDLVGLVTNPNTIPGDKSALRASGIRLGTPWVSQRGLKENDMALIADIIGDVLLSCQPYSIDTKTELGLRAKVDFKVFEDSKIRVRALAEKAGGDLTIEKRGYPFFYFIDDLPLYSKNDKFTSFAIKGDLSRQFVNFVFTADFEDLKPGQTQKTKLVTTEGVIDGSISLDKSNSIIFSTTTDSASLASSWLRDLSDGYVYFDIDLARRIPGPVEINEIEDCGELNTIDKDLICKNKPFYIGVVDEDGEQLPVFNYKQKDSLNKTSLYETHKKLSAKIIPFAGWEMPVWYSSIIEEHKAVRNTAGLFDVTHMGVYQAEGPDAAIFLDSVCGNDISGLEIGESCYTHFLDPDANVIDDLLVYRHNRMEYLVVVNAANDDKDWTWLNAVRDGEVLVDLKRPWARAFGRNVILHNLRDPKAGEEMRVDIALQGPKSKEVLASIPWNAADQKKLSKLKRTHLCHASLGDVDVIISRTGYTGEKMAFELFIHPKKAPILWDLLMENGSVFGLKPCGLGARDSLRTEAGLPLYGHEMGGELNLGVSEAGFGSYVKSYKPWFIGRDSFLKREEKRTGVVTRFRFVNQQVRMAHLGDPILDEKGKVIGSVTSCAIDQEGYLTGQAFLEMKYSSENTPIFIFQDAKAQNDIHIKLLKSGERAIMPSPAIVISRFPK